MERLFQGHLEPTYQLSEQHCIEQAILNHQHRLEHLLAYTPAVIYSSRPCLEYGVTFVSESVVQFGYQPQDFLGNLDLWRECLHPEDATTVLETLAQTLSKEHWLFEYRFLRRNGDYCWIQDRRRLVRDRQGFPVEMVGAWLDVTAQKVLEQSLLEAQDLAYGVLHSITDAVITINASGRIQFLNAVAEQMTGWSSGEAHTRILDEVCPIMQAQSGQTTLDLVKTVVGSGQIVSLPTACTLMTRKGTDYAIDGTIAPIRDCTQTITGAVMVLRDVTQHYALIRKLSWQASHDCLTGLLNRREFEQQLASAIANAQETGQFHTLCYLDLDQFKVVNDTCGHGAGDELLRQVSILLRQRLRSTDTLARIGGDEFGLILHECTLATASGMVEQILDLMRGFRFVWQHNIFCVGASIGLALIDASSCDSNAILGAADAACYAAKEKGRNRAHVYQVDDLDLVQQRGERQWVARIVKAIEEKRLCLYQQEIVPLSHAAGAKKHYELLLRLVDESGSVVAPNAFIPAAERYSLMPTLDRWVISHFFATYQRYRQQLAVAGREFDCVYTINLSGLSINDEQFLRFLKDQFVAHNILPHTLCFEITETAAISNLARAATLIAEMKQLGCFFALDDFGSGMSSFTYLKHLPIDYIKIDGSFIHNMIADSIDSTLVECINRIGHEMGIKTVAEWVENDVVLDKLRDMGVDYVQGYGLAAPTLVPDLFSFND
ncbi:MAG TPA: EAL domain-containing protein [Stenomitos sp.]